MRHRLMNVVILNVILVFAGSASVIAGQASVETRVRLSETVASYIHDYPKSNGFQTNLVEIGAAATDGQFALADWRSVDGKPHGQVAFYYLCDHWNLGKISMGSPLSVQDLVGVGFSAVPRAVASKLVSDLRALEVEHIAYLKPAKATGSC